jgi:hypothetical protein
MASAAARALPLIVTKLEERKEIIRRMVKISLELPQDRKQFANLFFVRTMASCSSPF